MRLLLFFSCNFLLTLVAMQGQPSSPPAIKSTGKIKAAWGNFTVSNETTHVTKRFDAERYIDYATAINDRMSQGITKQNNAAVLIWQVVGPRPTGVTMSSEVFTLSGISPPSDTGNYWVPLATFIKDRTNLIGSKLEQEVQDIWTRATARPWT